MAVSAIGNARPVVQNQLPAPVSSLSDIKNLNGLDTAIASRGATYVIQQLGADKYSQTITGLKALLNPNGAATPNYISAFDNYDTALAFVQALGHSQDNNGDTNTVADTYLATLEDNKEADACIAAMPSLNGAPEATAVTDLYGKCCPVIKKALDNAPSLNGKSGLVNFLVSEQSNYNILSKCPATTS